jgi:hypothetical protein
MRNSGFVWLVFGGIAVCSLTFVMHNTAFGRTRTALLVTLDADSFLASRSDSLVVAAKDSTSDSTAQRSSLKWYSMITNIPGDWVTYYKQKIQPTSIPEFLSLGVLTAGLIVTDDATYEVSDRWYKNSKAVSDVSDFFVSLGDGKSQFALAGAFAAYGLVSDDHKALRTGSQIAQAVLASGAVVQLLKHLTGRESPFVRSSPTGIWRFFPNQIEYHKHVPVYDAFPSGHICTALATVIVIAENYPETKWIRPVGYVLSGLVGVGMVNRGIHWYSDYPLGLALGYAFGMIAAHPDGITVGESTDVSKMHVSIVPTMGEQGVGLSMSIVF